MKWSCCSALHGWLPRVAGLLLVELLITGGLRAQFNHVVMVIIDGARYTETLGDPTGQYIPKMSQLAQKGMVVDTFLNDMYTYTSRAIPAIWCGSWSIPKDTTIDGVENQYATVPTVWEYYRKTTGAPSTQAMYIMKSVTGPWIQSYFPNYGPDFWPRYVVQGSSDVAVWQNARALLQAYHPKLSVIYLADVDREGHTGIWTNYTTAIRTADSIVGMLWDFLQTDPIFQNTTTLFVTNDHGRHDDSHGGFKSHGDGCWGCRRIMFLGLGYRMPKGIRAKHYTIPDITPTIGALLQFPTPFASGVPMTDLLTSTESPRSGEPLPKEMRLEQNYPNPFNPSTTIAYTVGSPGLVRLSICDVLGRVVSTLVNSVQAPGTYTAHWNAEGAPSGVYYYRLQSGNRTESRQMALIR